MTRAEALALPRLPGNTPWESALIQRWIRDEGGIYASFTFNYRIGTALDPGPGVDPSIRRGSILNTMKRIDCLAYTSQGVFIVEGKIVADLAVLGQFQGYQHILERDEPGIRILGYVLVAHGLTPDTGSFLRRNGVLVYVYRDVVPPGSGLPPGKPPVG